MAFAMAGAQPIPLDKVASLSANWGNFEGENAFAFGAAARISENVFLSAGIGLGTRSGTVGGRAGLSWAW